MKSIIKLIFIILCFFLFTSFVTCHAGSISFTNAYESYVVVHLVFLRLLDDTIAEISGIHRPGSMFTMYLGGNVRLIAIRIETMEGEVLVNYTLEYLTLLRNAYQRERQQDSWVFSEKGLFISHPDIRHLLEYYRSDEAVQYLQMLLSQMSTD
jgi:hypothetical protein